MAGGVSAEVSDAHPFETEVRFLRSLVNLAGHSFTTPAAPGV